MAQLAIAAVGAGIGASIGGTFLGLSATGIGWSIGSIVGSYLFQPDLPDTFGPRMNDLSVSTSNDGADIPIIWGTVRLAGNVIWADPIIEHKHTEEYGGKGGPSGEQTTYTYTATFAISFGMFESTHVRRIWANKKLIYDARVGAVAVSSPGLNFRLHTGSATQTADSTIEAAVGSGNASGYRGQTYATFINLPLADYGNRFPSIEAELTTSGTDTPSYVFEGLESSNYYPKSQIYDPKRELFWQGYGDVGDNAKLVACDPYSKSVVKTIELGTAANPVKLSFINGNLAVRYATGGTSRLAIYDPDTLANLYDETTGGTDPVEVGDYLFLHSTSNCYLYKSTTNTQHSSPSEVSVIPTGWVLIGSVKKVGESRMLAVFKRTADNEIGWAEFTPFIHDGTLANWETVSHDAALSGYSASSEVVYDSINDLYWWIFDNSGIVLLATDKDFNHVYEYDLDSYVSDVASHQFGSVMRPRLFFDESSSGIWMNLDRTDASPPTAKIVKFDVISHDWTQWQHSITTIGGAGYHAPTDTFMVGTESEDSQGGPLWVRVNSVSTSEYAVADIIDEICDMVGLEAASVNTSQVTDTVIGYRHSRRTSARSDIEPLLRLFFLDAVQSDYQLKFIPRGGASVATIPESDLAAHEEGSSPPDKVEHVIPQDIDIPKSLDLQYLSDDAAQQPAVARAQWVTGHSERSASISVPIVFADQEGIEKADALLMQWHDVEPFRFSLSRKWSHLDPGDVVTIPIDDKTYDVLMNNVERGANGLNKCSSVLYGSSNQTSYAEGGGSYGDNDVIAYGPANTIIIDAGLLRDVDEDHPGPYIAAYNYTTGFPVVIVYRSTDGSDYQPVGSIINEPTMGRCSTVPSAVEFEDWDTTNSLTVDFINGTPSTITDAQVLAGGNAVAWGQPGRWEIIQFANKALVFGAQYTISRLLRGRRGTDWAMGMHQAADLFVLIDAESMMRVIMTNADIGNDRWFKLPLNSQSITDAATNYWQVGNTPLMPYSASDPSAAYSSGTGWVVDWTRRTRRGGLLAGPNSVTDGIEGSISEDAESYEVDVYLQADPDTILRELTATSSTVTYTDAQMSTDGIVLWQDIGFDIYQISTVVGRGYVRELLVDGAGDALTVLNPGAETAGAGSLPANWTQDSSSGSATFQRALAPTPPGTGYAFNCYHPTLPPVGAYARGIQLIDMIAAGYSTAEMDTGTAQIFMSSDVVVITAAAVGDNEFCFGFRFYDATPTLLSSSIQAWTATTGFTEDVWQSEFYSATIPTGTRQIGFVIGVKRGSGYVYLKTMMDNVVAKVLV